MHAKLSEALIELESETRASQEPACGPYCTGRKECKGDKIIVYQPEVKHVFNHSGDSTTPRRESRPGLAENVTGQQWPVTHDGASVVRVDEVFDNRTIMFRLVWKMTRNLNVPAVAPRMVIS